MTAAPAQAMEGEAGTGCPICGAAALDEVPGFAALARVTSDARPWPEGGRLAVCGGCGAIQKIADAAWRAEAAAIYAGYAMYHQSDGDEQAVFDAAGGAGAPRSVRLVDYLGEHLGERLEPPGSGRLLDFGCGNGAFLAAFAARRPGWRLFGAEIGDRTLPALRRIPGFEALYTGPAAAIPGHFTLISLIHALEHLPQPVATLAELRGRLDRRGGAGRLFIEVPDCRKTPYDLVIADHLLHFTPGVLERTGRRAGCRRIALSDGVVSKELSWLGRAAAEPEPQPADAAEDAADARTEAAANRALVRGHLAWLRDQAAAAARLAEASPCFGLFGTSISGTWLAGILGGRVAFFVDEDPARIGRSHMDRPIHAPAAAPPGADVFVPLIPETAAAVVRRLGGEGGGATRFHAPPPRR